MTPTEAYFSAAEWYKKLGFVPPELEEIIATDAQYSYLYARYVLEGRFELGEAAIATSAGYSFYYAVYPLNRKFELGEPVILNSKYKNLYLNFLSVKGILL